MIEKDFKLTKAGEIPKEWDSMPLSELFDFGNGYTPSKADAAFWTNGTIPWFRVEDIRINGHILNDAIQKITPLAVKGDLFPKNSFIISTSATIGEYAYVTKPYLANQRFVCLIKKATANQLVDDGYFLCLCESLGQWCRDNCDQGSSFPSVNMQSFRNHHIPLPPLAEQKKIAKALSDVDALINYIDGLIAKKRDIKQGTMQQLLTGRLRIQGFNEPWKRRKLKEIAEMNSGGTPSSKESHYYGGKINFLSISDMTLSGKYIKRTDKTITELGLQNSSARLFPSGTLMYAMYASLGKCSITQVETAVSQAILGFKLTSQIDRDYLYHHFNFIEEKVKMMGQTGTQSNLSKSIVENFDIILPCIEEQKAIANILNNMDDEIFALEAKKAKYKSIKQGMKQELLTGKIRLV